MTNRKQTILGVVLLIILWSIMVNMIVINTMKVQHEKNVPSYESDPMNWTKPCRK